MKLAKKITSIVSAAAMLASFAALNVDAIDMNQYGVSYDVLTNDIEISVAVAVIIIQLDLRMKVVERLIYQIVDGTLGIIVIVIAIAFCIIGKDLITMQMELSVGRRLIKAVHTL